MATKRRSTIKSRKEEISKPSKRRRRFEKQTDIAQSIGKALKGFKEGIESGGGGAGILKRLGKLAKRGKKVKRSLRKSKAEQADIAREKAAKARKRRDTGVAFASKETKAKLKAAQKTLATTTDRKIKRKALQTIQQNLGSKVTAKLGRKSVGKVGGQGVAGGKQAGKTPGRERVDRAFKRTPQRKSAAQTEAQKRRAAVKSRLASAKKGKAAKRSAQTIRDNLGELERGVGGKARQAATRKAIKTLKKTLGAKAAAKVAKKQVNKVFSTKGKTLSQRNREINAAVRKQGAPIKPPKPTAAGFRKIGIDIKTGKPLKSKSIGRKVKKLRKVPKVGKKGLTKSEKKSAADSARAIRDNFGALERGINTKVRRQATRKAVRDLSKVIGEKKAGQFTQTQSRKVFKEFGSKASPVRTGKKSQAKPRNRDLRLVKPDRRTGLLPPVRPSDATLQRKLDVLKKAGRPSQRGGRGPTLKATLAADKSQKADRARGRLLKKADAAKKKNLARANAIIKAKRKVANKEVQKRKKAAGKGINTLSSTPQEARNVRKALKARERAKKKDLSGLTKEDKIRRKQFGQAVRGEKVTGPKVGPRTKESDARSLAGKSKIPGAKKKPLSRAEVNKALAREEAKRRLKASRKAGTPGLPARFRPKRGPKFE